MLVSVSAIIAFISTSVVLVVVGRVLFQVLFDSHKKQLHCSESVVAMFCNVLLVFPRSGFLYFMGLSTSRVSSSSSFSAG
jgi:hypothetical protein